MSYTATLAANNLALQEMNRVLAKLDETMGKISSSQKEYTKQVKKAKDAEEEVNKALSTREKVLDKAMDSQLKFEIFSKKSFDAYREAGGNAFDYLDLAITSTKQQVKLFGVEAALVRKVMYGFLPPGMFRMVNKFSTGFRFLGGLLRKVGDNADEADNIFSKMTRGMMKGAIGLSKVLTMRRKDFNIMSKLKGGFNEAKRIGNVSKSFNPIINEEKQKIRDAGRQMAQGKISEDEFDIIFKQAQEQIELLEEARDKAIEQSKLGKFTNKFVKGIKGLPKLISQGLLFMGKMLIYGMLVITVAYILWKTVGKTLIEAIQAAWPAIKESLKFVGFMFKRVIDGVAQIFHGFFGKDGNFEDVIDGAWKIISGLLGVAVGIIGVGLVILGGIIIEFSKLAATKIIDWFADIKEDWTTIFKSIPMILAIIVVVVLFIFNAPVWLAVIAFVAVYKGVSMLVKWMKNKFSFMATGGTVSSDMQVVGEKGPELVSLPRGSKVRSNSNSKNRVGGSTVNNFNITVNARDSSKAEMRRMADEIGRMVSSSINRSTSSNTMR